MAWSSPPSLGKGGSAPSTSVGRGVFREGRIPNQQLPAEPSAPWFPPGPGNHEVQCALPGRDMGLSPHLCCFVPTVLQGPSKDTSPLVSSLATQTLLILGRGRLKSRFNLPRLSLQMTRARMRSHSVPSEDSAQAETTLEPQP